MLAEAAGIPTQGKIILTLKHEYHTFTLNLGAVGNSQFFRQDQPTGAIGAAPLGENPFFCREGQAPLSASDTSWTIDSAAVEKLLKDEIAPKLNQAVSPVTISRDAKGDIVFDGAGEFGQELDIDASVRLIETAAENGIDKVTLAVKKTDPVVTVTDPELQIMGIRELVSVGWSNFANSPSNRRHNIQVGESRFNGVLIKPGEVFSFNKQLGPVDGSTGYLKELVIAGPNTVPEFGGGLCQVSSTAYRGAMLAGLPIVERKNHSYAVVYYAPTGSDATIYPGSADLKFTNDTPGAILLQTRIVGDNLYYHYYGTNDTRQVSILGPYLSNPRPAPAPVYRTSTTIPVGSTQSLSGIHPGIDALWLRFVQKPQTDVKTPADPKQDGWQSFFSHYQARGLILVKGVAKEEVPAEPGTVVPVPTELPE